MATLTVRDAARRLGVKPRKVRLYISERKLSAHTGPHVPGQRGQDRLLLDADEVETLAQVRAYKRGTRPRERVTSRAPAMAPAIPAVEDNREPPPVAEEYRTPAGPAVGERSAPVAPSAEKGRLLAVPSQVDETSPSTPAQTIESGSPSSERAAWQAAVFVQPLLEPLVAELHDARETIRRQAEELGALRATVANLECRLAHDALSEAAILPPDVPAKTTLPPDASAETTLLPDASGKATVWPPDVAPDRGAPPPAGNAPGGAIPFAPHITPGPRQRPIPLWQRALAHLLA